MFQLLPEMVLYLSPQRLRTITCIWRWHPAVVLQPAILSNPIANLPHALLKAANALVIKQVCMLSDKPKTAKPWPELA